MINTENRCLGCMNEKVMEGKCPICGYVPDEPTNPFFLKPGTMLDSRYLVGTVLDTNGEGVTYIGYDTVTAVTVNIREFLPLGLCERDSDGTTVLMLSGSEYSFNDNLIKFTELSRELFKLNELPALFDILDVRESNNTAYRITRAVPGISLREFLMRNGGLLKWDQARSLFAPLVSSISALHKAGIIHRGISPDTLIVGKDGKLRLNGFSIAECRTAKSSLTSQLFPGFAAIEQYGVAGTQGPWTDIYAFAATIYRTLVGNPPPEATDRFEDDNMTIPAKIARETPKAVLETLANALQVLPSDRTQNIDSMRHGLSVSSVQTNLNNSSHMDTVNSTARKPKIDDEPESKQPVKQKKNNTNKMYGIVAGIVTAFLLTAVILFVLFMLGVFENDDVSSNISSGNGLGSYTAASKETPTSKMEITDSGKIELISFVGYDYAMTSISNEYKDQIKLKVISKQYSDDFPAGQIISQTPKAGESIDMGTTVEVVVSLGSSSFNMIDVRGLDRDAALLALVKAGVPYQNIYFINRYDENAQPGVAIQSDPEPNLRVPVDMPITVVINTYTGPIVEPPTNNSQESSVTQSTESQSSTENNSSTKSRWE